MVPMAPSSTRMRSRATRRSVSLALVMVLFDICVLRCSDPPHPTPLPCGEREQAVLVALFVLNLLRRPEPQQVTHRIDQVGAVHGVEMEIRDAAVDEIEHLLGGDRGRAQLA